MITENSEASRPSRLWSEVWEQLCPDTAPLLLERYCCSHFPETDNGEAHVFWCIEADRSQVPIFSGLGEVRAALFQLASYVLAEIELHRVLVHWGN